MRFILNSIRFVVFCCAIGFSACDDPTTPPIDTPDPTVAGTAQLADWVDKITTIAKRAEYNGPMASRILAYCSVAYYQGFAVGNADMPTLVGKLNRLDSLPQPALGEAYNYGIVATAATFKVASRMFQNDGQSNLLSISSTFNSHMNSYFQSGMSQSMIDRSAALGYEIGDAINVWAANDNYNAAIEGIFSGGTGPEVWRPTPPSNTAGLLPNWWLIRPFTFTFDEVFSLCPPDAPTPFSLNDNSEYQLALADLMQATSDLNTEQLTIARTWADTTGSFTVSGHYSRILHGLINQFSLNGKEAAQAWAQVSLAMADLHILAYYWKYDLQRIRPVSVIRYHIDPNWLSPVQNTPAPEFPSERAACATAAANIFTDLFGDKAFNDATYSTSGLGSRSFTGFGQMAQEAGMAQLYGGTELRATVDKSRGMGECMAARVKSKFQP